ncbi:MAG: S41 family peptidase [Oscillospiraceae bacterium]|nr:S41 family peptidase [Oscillospiraceae bacterium]
MKKIIIMLCIAVLFALSACSQQTDDAELKETEYEYEYTEWLPTAEPDTEAAMTARPRQPSPLEGVQLAGRTREGFLQDFDYMMWVLEDNFPYFGVIYRRHGVDMREKAALTRGIIADESVYIDSQIFFDIVMENFFAHGHGVGHLSLVSGEMYHHRRELLTTPRFGFAGDPLVHPNGWAITSPASVEFYGEEFHMSIDEIIAMQSGNEENLRLEILEEGSVAYLRMATMNFTGGNANNDVVRILEIYDKIEEFEHLIIDIRGNRGGAGLFELLILMPNIINQIEVPYGYFYMAGGHNVRVISYFDWFNNLANPMFHFESVALDNLDRFPYLNEDDMQLFDYALSVIQILPNMPLAQPATGVVADPFSGKIWLLIDEYVFSAADNAAFVSRYSGVITIVGAQSGGVYSGPEPVWISLPNSGIIFRYDAIYLTDQYGRGRNEHPVMPHYLNRPSMDALETALALIAEGNY